MFNKIKQTITAIGLLFMQAIVADGQQVSFTQVSEPSGIVNQSALYPLGTVVTTVNAPMESGANRFTHWTLNGARTNDFLGCAVNPLRLAINFDTTVVANYTNSLLDTDMDGVADWFELYYMGSLASDGSSDADGDGYTLFQEYVRDYQPLIKDRIAAGGISRRQSAQIQMRITAKQYTFTSDPAGLVNQSSLVEPGTVVQTQNLQGNNGNYTFGYWTVEGVRQEDRLGRALSQLKFTVTNDLSAVAHYFLNTDDTDNDGLPDWWEWLNYGSLAYDGSSDSDHDGYTLFQEYWRDYEPLIKDRIVAGGVSRRQSAQIQMRITAKQYTFTSDPAGLVNQSSLVETGTVVQTQNLQGNNGNYTFGYWTVEGVRQEDRLGRALSQLKFTVTNDLSAVAHYFLNTDDTDNDGLPDWWEWLNYGSLAYDGSSDTDHDGYTLVQEYWRDYEPLINDRIVSGGISRRQGTQLFYVRPTPRINVVSEYGGTTIPQGTNLFDWAASVTCQVTNSPIQMGTTQYVCTASLVAGNAFTQVSQTQVTLTITNNATLTVQWQTNYWLQTGARGHGAVLTTNQWASSGSNVVLLAQPEVNYHVDHWEGDIDGCFAQGNQISVPMDRSRQISAVFAGDDRILVIFSECGGATPSVGIHVYPYGTVLSCSVLSPVVLGTTRYAISGWTGMGDVPASGTSSDTGDFILTMDSAISWNWQLEYLLDTEAIGFGVVDVPDAWITSGNIRSVVATLGDPAVFFTGWTGDTNGCFVNGNKLFAIMDKPRRIVANFTSPKAPLGTPLSWFFLYGLTSLPFNLQEMSDPDNDGYLNWEEFVAGTNPTNENSYFKAKIEMSNGNPIIGWIPDLGVERIYRVFGKTNLLDASWSPTNGNSRFFRVDVELKP